MSVSPLETLILARSSVRRYDERPVPDEHILSVIEAARLAPSAENSQPWRFVVVKDAKARDALSRESFAGHLFPHALCGGGARDHCPVC